MLGVFFVRDSNMIKYNYLSTIKPVRTQSFRVIFQKSVKNKLRTFEAHCKNIEPERQNLVVILKLYEPAQDFLNIKNNIRNNDRI